MQSHKVRCIAAHKYCRLQQNNIMHDVDNVEKWLHACNLQYYLLQVLWLSVPAMSRQNWVRAPFFCTCEIFPITIQNDDDDTASANDNSLEFWWPIKWWIFLKIRGKSFRHVKSVGVQFCQKMMFSTAKFGGKKTLHALPWGSYAENYLARLYFSSHN